MPITERAAQLRKESLEAVPSISTERAELYTQFYQQDHGLLSAPVKRALAFQHYVEHRTIFIGAGELIVGEKGHQPKAAPTFPELCCHSLQDLDLLDSREKIPFKVTREAPPALQRNDHPQLAGQIDPRTVVCQYDIRLAGCLQRRDLHRVHGAARPGPYRAR